MREAKNDIEKRGAKLVIVGNGAPRWAKAFAEETHLEGHVYADPSRALYDALGMKRGAMATLDPRSAAAIVRAFSKGYRQTKVRGDPWQQGGAIVVTKSGALAYAYVSRFPGDHAPLDAVLGAIPAEERAAS